MTRSLPLAAALLLLAACSDVPSAPTAEPPDAAQPSPDASTLTIGTFRRNLSGSCAVL